MATKKGESAMDVIADRYRDLRGRIEVPELGLSNDEPLVIFYKPYTIQDDRSVSRFMREDNPDGFAQIIINKAEDEDGNKIFDKGDKPRLVRTAPALVLKRVAMQIMTSTNIEEAEKNSDPTPAT